MDIKTLPIVNFFFLRKLPKKEIFNKNEVEINKNRPHCEIFTLLPFHIYFPFSC